MSDFTTTNNFALKKPTVGQAVDTWGTYINANFDVIDQELQTLTVSITTPDLEGLGNVLALTPSTDQFLRFNGESWAATTVTIATQIDDLTDVDLSTSPTTNQVLTWSGSSWIAATPSAATIADNSITTSKLATDLQTIIGRILVTDDDDTPTNGQILKYNTTDSEWKYADLPGSTVVTLGDVNSGSLADNALLVYNSSAGEFQFESGSTLRTTLGVDPSGTDNSTNISISSATSYDYITLSAGQVLTINQVNLGTDVTGTLPVASGGTGSTTASGARTALGLGTISTQDSDDVTITGGNISGIVDLAIADGGTGASSVSAARSNLGLGGLATQDTITESQISDLGSYITASSTDTLTNKSGNISQWTNDSGFLTAETNDLSAAVTWANVPDANITQSSVTQHQAALSITESQISDLGSYQTSDAGLTSIAGLTTAADKMLYTTASDVYAVADLTSAGRALLDDADAAAQRTTLGLGSLATQSTITESQISDLQGYLTAETNDLGTAVTGTLGTANGGTGLTTIGTAGQVLRVNSGATALEFADESGGGGSGSTYIEHSSTVSDSLATSAGTNRMYVGNTTFSGSGTMAGYLVISHGYANFTGTVNVDTTGTLNVVI